MEIPGQWFSGMWPSQNTETSADLKVSNYGVKNFEFDQKFTYRLLQTIQMNLILLYVWAEPADLGSTKTAIKFKYEI